MSNQPTDEQLAALDAWRARQGRRWKENLRWAWETGNYEMPSLASALQQLRNEFGPRWLIAYRPGDTKVGYLQRFRDGNAIAWRHAYRVVDADGELMLMANYYTKTDARDAARWTKITLIEDPK